MKDTLIQNWQYLTLLIAILGTWLSLLNIAKSDNRSLRSDLKSDMAELKADLKADIRNLKTDAAKMETSLKADISDLKGLVQHFIDLHIGHESRISTVEEKTKKL